MTGFGSWPLINWEVREILVLKFITLTPDIARARAKWRYIGRGRPSFAEEPGPDQRSVWDFPRPPIIEPVDVLLRVECKGRVLASTHQGRCVLETAGAPTYYFPPQDVAGDIVQRTERTFICEWKGMSQATSTSAISKAGWTLTALFPEFASLYGWYAFYPQQLHCFVGEEQVRAQPGGYYGGWVTRDLVGPIKGAWGSGSW